MNSNSRRAQQGKDLDKSNPFAIRRANWEDQVIADADIPHKDMRTVMKFRQLWRSRTGTVILRKDGHEEEGLELLAKLRGQTKSTISKCIKRLEQRGHVYIDKSRRPHEYIPMLRNDDRQAVIDACHRHRKTATSSFRDAATSSFQQAATTRENLKPLNIETKIDVPKPGAGAAWQKRPTHADDKATLERYRQAAKRTSDGEPDDTPQQTNTNGE